jgi:hypothetical protein
MTIPVPGWVCVIAPTPERRRSMRRSLRLSLALLFVLAVTAVALPLATPAAARTRISYTEGTLIEIRLPIALEIATEADAAPRPHPSGRGQPIEPATYFERNITNFWEELPAYRYKTCFAFSLTVSVTPVLASDPRAELPADARLVRFDPNLPPAQSSAGAVVDPYTENAGDSEAVGTWGWGPISHIMGAYLGLGPTPIRIIDQALVDRLGQVVEEHLRAEGTELPTSCLSVRQEVDFTNETPVRIYHARGTLEVWATMREDGTLVADARFTGGGKGTGADPCQAGGTAPYTLTITYEAPGLVATGSRKGDHVAVLVRGKLRTTIVTEGTGCSGSPATKSDVNATDFQAPVELAGNLSSGRFEDDQTLQPDPETTLRVHTVIEEKSVPTGAEPAR